MARHDREGLAWPVGIAPAEEVGFVVNFPDFPEGWSQGETQEEALAQAADLLETMVANYMAEGWDLPAPSSTRGRILVRLDPLVGAKTELYQRMRQAGVTKAELARRIGIAPQQAQRLFDIHHASRLDQLDAAFAALGRRLVVSSEAA